MVGDGPILAESLRAVKSVQIGPFVFGPDSVTRETLKTNYSWNQEGRRTERGAKEFYNIRSHRQGQLRIMSAPTPARRFTPVVFMATPDLR